MENTLYYGDNLDIMRRHLTDESVDLVYISPGLQRLPCLPPACFHLFEPNRPVDLYPQI